MNLQYLTGLSDLPPAIHSKECRNYTNSLNRKSQQDKDTSTNSSTDNSKALKEAIAKFNGETIKHKVNGKHLAKSNSLDLQSNKNLDEAPTILFPKHCTITSNLDLKSKQSDFEHKVSKVKSTKSYTGDNEPFKALEVRKKPANDDHKNDEKITNGVVRKSKDSTKIRAKGLPNQVKGNCYSKTPHFNM